MWASQGSRELVFTVLEAEAIRHLAVSAINFAGDTDPGTAIEGEATHLLELGERHCHIINNERAIAPDLDILVTAADNKAADTGGISVVRVNLNAGDIKLYTAPVRVIQQSDGLSGGKVGLKGLERVGDIQIWRKEAKLRVTKQACRT